MILRIATLLLLSGASLPLMAQETRTPGPDGNGGCPTAISAEDRGEATRAAPAPQGADNESVSKDKASSAPRGGNAENSVRSPRTHSLLPGMFR